MLRCISSSPRLYFEIRFRNSVLGSKKRVGSVMCLFRLYNDEPKCSERSMKVELPAYLKKMNDNYEIKNTINASRMKRKLFSEL